MLAFIDWFQQQLEQHNISKAELSRISGISLSTMKKENLTNHPLKIATVIVICESLVKHSGGTTQDFKDLVTSSLLTIPQYNYAIKRLEKKQ